MFLFQIEYCHHFEFHMFWYMLVNKIHLPIRWFHVSFQFCYLTGTVYQTCQTFLGTHALITKVYLSMFMIQTKKDE